MIPRSLAADKMGTGEFKLAKQVGRKGFYAHVVLSAERNDNGEVVVEFDEKLGNEWRSGARFGVDYALEHVPRETIYPDGLIVRVQMVHGMVCDTTDSAGGLRGSSRGLSSIGN